jgi:PAS domain S-box-containing protein
LHNEVNKVPKAPYVTVFALAVAIALVALVYTGYAMYQQARSAAVTAAHNTASIVEIRFEATLRRLVSTLDALSATTDAADLAPDVPAQRAAFLARDLRLRAANFPEISQITLVDANGQVRYSSVGAVANFGARNWFKEVKAHPGRDIIFSEVFVGNVIKRPIMAVARPIRGPAGELVGAAVASLDLTYFQHILSSLDLGQGRVLNIRRTEDARLVVRWPDLGANYNSNVHTELTESMVAGLPSGVYRFDSVFDHRDRLWTYERVSDFPFAVIAGVAADDFLAAWWRAMGVVAFLTLLLLALLGAFLFLARLWRLRQLALTDAIRSSEQRFRSLADLSSDWYWEQDAELRLTDYSEKPGVVMRMGHTDNLGKRRWELSDIDDDPKIWAPHQAQLMARQPFRDFVYRRRGADGDWQYVSVSGDPVFGADSGFAGYRGTGRNVTEHYRMLEEIRHSEARLASIIATAMDGVVIADAAHNIVLFNKAAEQIFGYAREEVLNRHVSLLLPPAARALHDAHMDGYAAQFAGAARKMSPRLPVSGRRKDGSEFPLEASISHVRTERGALLTAIVRDITERLAAEAAVRSLNASLDQRVRERTAELEQANRELEGFSYSVSHDLRAPLRAIGGYTAMLKEELGARAGGETERLLGKVLAGVGRMSTLIDDVLEYARVTRSELVRAQMDLDAAVAEVAADLRIQYPRTRFAAQPLGSANCDPAMMRQILANLIGNAFKYSAMRDAPAVSVGWRMRGAAREFFVSDNGMGFDMRYSKHIYGMFHRLHADAGIPGNGVGLAIVKRLVERHGGSVAAEAKPGEGATFSFTIA